MEDLPSYRLDTFTCTRRSALTATPQKRREWHWGQIPLSAQIPEGLYPWKRSGILTIKRPHLHSGDWPFPEELVLIRLLSRGLGCDPNVHLTVTLFYLAPLFCSITPSPACTVVGLFFSTGSGGTLE